MVVSESAGACEKSQGLYSCLFVASVCVGVTTCLRVISKRTPRYYMGRIEKVCTGKGTPFLDIRDEGVWNWWNGVSSRVKIEGIRRR